MIKLRINDIEISVKEGATVLDAARKAGVEIPTLCHYEGLEAFTSCMVCMVRDDANGKLFPSCSMPAQEGMQIITGDEEVTEARRMALELLLSEHVGDCEAPCVTACPAHMDIPRMNRLLAEGKSDEALAVVREDIAMPATLGYICSAPCEGACKRKPIDNPVAICLLKRFAGMEGKSMVPEIEMTDKTALVIGAGPAGLAAAWQLQTNGIRTTLVDKAAQPGGALWSAVEEKTLPKQVLKQETAFILSSGIQWQPDKTVSENEITELKEQYDVILIATGQESCDFGLESSKQGITVDRETFRTSDDQLFAAGSATRKTKLAIAALAQGKRAAKAMIQYLNGQEVTGETTRFNSKMGRLMEEEVQEYLAESVEYNQVETAWEAGYTKEQVIEEAKRCMHCDCRDKKDCKLREYADKYHASQKAWAGDKRLSATKQMQHDLVIYEPAKCIKCGICVRLTAKHQESFGMTFIGRGFDVVVGVPFGKDTKVGLEKVAKEVVEACPVGALTAK